MTTETVSFPGSLGHDLTGLLDLPDAEPPKALAVFAHCFTCSKDLRVVKGIARQLTSEGLGLLRFDFTGLGHSEGDFEDTTFSSNTEDLIHASAWLNAHYEAPRLMIGHSLGGAAVLATAGRVESVRAVCTIGAPCEPSHVQHLLGDADFSESESAEVSIGGRAFRIGRDFVEDLDEHRMRQAITALDRPLLIFHSPVDQIVGIDNAEKIYRAARHPKSFVSLDDSDHLVTDPRAAAYLGHVLSAWAHYYIT